MLFYTLNFAKPTISFLGFFLSSKYGIGNIGRVIISFSLSFYKPTITSTTSPSLNYHNENGGEDTIGE